MKRFLLVTWLLFPVCAFGAGGMQTTILTNGLTLYTVEDHSKPLISLFSIVDGGSRTETPDIAGLSHFYEHLIARGGSAKQGETEFRRRMSSLGEENIYTYDDGTAYGFTVPTENFPEALWRLADFMLELKPDSASIIKERTIVMEEYNMSVADNPQGRLQEQLMKAAFTRHPYYPTTIGLPEVIQNATYEQLRTFYEERYIPNQIVMAVVGDFRTEEMIAWITQQFSKYKPGRISFEQGLVEPPQTSFRQVADTMKVTSSYVLLGYPIPPLAHPDIPSIRVLAHILGGSAQSRLDQGLKINENLVLYVYSYPDPLRDASLLYVGFQCEPNKEDTALRKTLYEIQRLVREGVTEAELTTAKEKLIADEILSRQTFRGQAENICHYHVARAEALAEQIPALIRAVSAADVQRVARQYLEPDHLTLSLIEPAGSTPPDYSVLPTQYGFQAATQQINQATVQTQHFKLPNGLTLILREDHSSPTVCVSTFVKGGQWLEPAGQAGVASLTATLLDRGTEKYSRQQLQTTRECLGLNFWNSAAEDYLQVGFSGLSDRLAEGLGLLDQMLFHAALPEEEFAKAKDDQLQAIKALEDQPWEFTHREVQKDLYQKSPYRHPVIGLQEDVAGLTVGQVQDHYRQVFVPANIVVAVVGDFEPEALKRQMQELWAALPDKKAPQITLTADQQPGGIHARQVPKQKDQNTFNYTWLTVGVQEADFLPLVLTKRLLSTRLFYKWIYDKGMAYRMWTRMFPRLGQTRFYFEMGVSDENFPVARQGLLDDLQAFLDHPLEEAELVKAKEDEITRHRMLYQTNQGIADGLGSWEALGLGYQYFETLPEQLQAIKKQEVERAAHKYLHPDRYVLVNIGPAEIK